MLYITLALPFLPATSLHRGLHIAATCILLTACAAAHLQNAGPTAVAFPLPWDAAHVLAFDGTATLFLCLLLATHLAVLTYIAPAKGSGMAPWLAVMTFFLCFFVTTTDLVLLFLSFESALLPVLGLMGLWATGARRTHAGWLLLFFTFVAASCILPATVLAWTATGSTSMLALPASDLLRWALGLGWLLAALSKVPLVPLHLWLPEAHVQASTPTSIVLAAVLLKLSLYLCLRLLGGLWSDLGATACLGLLTLSLAGGALAVWMAGVQVDLKRVIAYASVAHMSAGTAAWAIGGAGAAVLLALTLTHSVIAGALFLAVGVAYETSHTRLVKAYGGLAMTTPCLALAWLVWSAGNIGLPGTAGFVPELWSILAVSSWSGLLLLAGAMFVGGLLYTMWAWARTMWGPQGTGIVWAATGDTPGPLGGTAAGLVILCLTLGVALAGFEGASEGFT